MVVSKKCLPVEAWPPSDRELWQRATKPGRRLLDASVATTWRPRTIATVAEGYGYALAWLQLKKQLDPTVAPDLRWSYERLEAFANELSTRLRPATVKNRLLSLERAIAVLAPASDRSLLRRIVQALELPRDDGRKRNRLQDPDRLVTLGLDLMAKAERGWHASPRKNATYFRDGLQIALLALRGLRKGNFAGIRIGTHLVQRNGVWWLSFDRAETKNHVQLEFPFPDQLLPHLHRYLQHYRPLLAGRRYVGDVLWLTYWYGPQAPHSLQLQVVLRTREAFGRPINPHLFRDSIATSIAIHDPRHVRIAATILGHSSFATTERHYNLARTVEASRRYSAIVVARRAALKQRRRRSQL